MPTEASMGTKGRGELPGSSRPIKTRVDGLLAFRDILQIHQLHCQFCFSCCHLLLIPVDHQDKRDIGFYINGFRSRRKRGQR